MLFSQTTTSAASFHYLSVAPGTGAAAVSAAATAAAASAAAAVSAGVPIRSLTLLGGTGKSKGVIMGSESPPAGFFSTFSVNDPNSSSAGGPDGQQTRAQKRNRRVFVCLSCHRKKLKCDKNSPCGRCVANGTADECTYQALPASSAASRSGRSSERQESSSTRASSQVGTRDRYLWFYRSGDGRCRASGASHWATVSCEFEEACPYLFGTDPRWEPRYTQIKNLKYLFPSLTSGANFPFSSGNAFPASREEILDSLPPRNITELFLRSYEASFETTHRLLHMPNFRQELEAFWANRANSSSVMDGWLAQLCIVLALGCQAAQPAALLEATGQTPAQWTETLLDGAHSSFSRSEYMITPTLTTIRTLCAMVMAKMMGLRGTNSWQVASLMAFVVRLATSSLQLHRSSALFQGMHELEAEKRNRVWTTVQLLDLDVALWAGTTPNCREQDAEAPLNANDADFGPAPAPTPLADGLLWVGPAAGGGGGGVAPAPSGEYTDGTYQSRLAELLPLLNEVVASANSPANSSGGGISSQGTSNKPGGASGASGGSSGGVGGGMDYDRVLRLDKRLRLRLRDAEAVLSAGRDARPDRMHTLAAQRQFLRVLVHRALLALHHPFARGPNPTRYDQSMRATMESCMALLNIQQHWAAADPAATAATSSSSVSPSATAGNIVVDARTGSVSSASPSPALGVGVGGTSARQQQQRQWLLDLCHDDFSIAAIYVILALRRGDCAEEGPATLTATSPYESSVPSADTFFAAVRRAVGIMRDRACCSVLHFKEFTGLSILLGCLRSGGFFPSGRRGSAMSGISGLGGAANAAADYRSRSPAGTAGDSDSLLLQAILQVANDVEDVVVTGKSDVIWSSAAAAAAAAASIGPGGSGAGTGPGGPGSMEIGVVPTHAHPQHPQHTQHPQHHHPHHHQGGPQQQNVVHHQHHGHHGQGAPGDSYSIMGDFMGPFQ